MGILFNLNPTLHRIGYSINIPQNTTLTKLIADLEVIFGLPTAKGKIKDWFNGEGIIKFKNAKARLSMPNDDNYHWSQLRFQPAQINTKHLIQVLTDNTGLDYASVKEPEDDADYQNIPTIEAKFDFAIKGFDQEDHQRLADFFSTIMIPVVPARNYYDYRKGKNQEKDNYINGNHTHYWYAHENNDILKGYYPRRAKRASFCKIYVKYSKEKKIWFIRFESTLKVYQIKRILGLNKDYDFDLPNEFIPIMNKIKKTKFSTYYEFYDVNYDRFICKLTNTDKFKQMSKIFSLDDFFKIRELERDRRFEKSAFKYNLMKILSQRLQTRKLSTSLRSFCNIISEEELIARINREFKINFEQRMIPLFNMY